MKFEQFIFISDVHLGAFPAPVNDKIEQDLIALIHHCKEQQIKIHVLGDLFDYWMEYPDKGFVPKLGKKVLDAFEEYNTTVAPALYITGNHDNWTFGHFKERGFDVEPNFKIIEIENKRILLMHGDGVADDTLGFPRARFHRLLRNSAFVAAYQKVLPPKMGISAMKLFSSITRRNNTPNPNPLNKQARKIFSQHNLDYILSGHDHIPRKETFTRGRYINLGTFFKHRTAALHTKREIKLVKWNAETKNFLPFELSN